MNAKRGDEAPVISCEQSTMLWVYGRPGHRDKRVHHIIAYSLRISPHLGLWARVNHQSKPSYAISAAVGHAVLIPIVQKQSSTINCSISIKSICGYLLRYNNRTRKYNTALNHYETQNMLRATIQESAIGKDTHEQYTAFTNLIEAHAAHPEAVFCKQCDKVLFCIIVRNKIMMTSS
eukprot:scaffold11193_cov71-Cyclotella_meneghiniana.AAC.2